MVFYDEQVLHRKGIVKNLEYCLSVYETSLGLQGLAALAQSLKPKTGGELHFLDLNC